MLLIVGTSFSLFLVAKKPNADNVVKKVKLRNGAFASEQRTEEVWQALQKKVFCHGWFHLSLWRTCLRAKNLNLGSCDIKKIDPDMSDKTIQEFDRWKITHNGILDEETQNIIISSSNGMSDPKLFALRHPIAKWYEKFPGYRSYSTIKGK